MLSRRRPIPLRTPTRRLAADRRGAAAIIFALSFIALIMFAGASVDIARMKFVRERLISATDAAALAGARTINSTGSGTGYITDANNFFNANFPQGYLGSTTPAIPTVTLSADRTQLSVTETVTLPLMFGAILGHTAPVPITNTSISLAGRIEVAMVLDNSGSMAQTVSGDSANKMSLMQSAAKSFASSLNSLQNGNVKISVVPFAAMVNVGLTQSSAPSWIDPTASYIYAKSGGALLTNALTVSTSQPSGTVFQDIFTDRTGANYQQNRFTLFSNLGTSWSGCVEMRAPIYSADGLQRYDVLDTQPSSSLPGSLVVPYFAPDEAKSNGSQEFINHYADDYSNDDDNKYTWQVAQGDYNKYTSPSGKQSFTTVQTSGGNPNFQGGYSFGPNSGCQGFTPSGSFVTLQPLSRLTTTLSSTNNTISGMNAMGDTYLPIALFWGWETISPNSVFADAQANYNDPGITKVIILLTDGCNHIGNPNGSGTANACGAYPGTTTTSYDFLNAGVFASIGYPWHNRIGPLSANPNPSGDPNLNFETDRQALADAETLTICTNIKADGVLIYAIGIDAQGSVNPVLQSCASAKQQPYYNSTPDPGTLTSVFQGIAQSLTKVRILAPAGSAPGI